MFYGKALSVGNVHEAVEAPMRMQALLTILGVLA